MSHFKNVFKALQECNRRKILNLLKDGEQCACYILEKFDISQPTFSHHMKVLLEADLVTMRKEGLWTFYAINKEKVKQVNDYLGLLINETKEITIPCECGNQE